MDSIAPKLFQSQHNVGNNTSEMASGLLSDGDCRVFCEFSKFYSLYKCSQFMNAKTNFDIEAQINILYRVKKLCKTNGFRNLKHNDVMTQYNSSVSALKEEPKCLSNKSGNQWSSNMDKTRTNVVRPNSLNGEIVSNKGDDHDILPTILTALRRMNAYLAKE